MRFIHTSDWHLGQRLYGRKRYSEFEQFLDWLAAYIETHPIDALLICGDVFDTTTPGNQALSLYYRFLHRIAGSSCRFIIIVAGNHDSPTLLEAPKELLNQLNIHVVGTPGKHLREQVFVLSDTCKKEKAIVCAIPFLRDRDIRSSAIGEDMATKSEKLQEAIRSHYIDVCGFAAKMQHEADSSIPIIATGHLFTAGGKTTEGDGVRELYVGGLAHLHSGAFPDNIDYLALGHLHIAQKVQGKENFRYCGSPLPTGFNEAGQTKVILDVECTPDSLQVEPVAVPRFQELLVLEGDLTSLTEQLEALKQAKSTTWVEIRHTGVTDSGTTRDTLFNLVEDTSIEILRIRTNRSKTLSLTQSSPDESLEELHIEDVFQRCLDASEFPRDYHRQLQLAFKEIVDEITSMEQDDR